ncbi:uncharacterized protein LOC114327297 [Diabrotica virgifera virgifera]|uniref:Uncharacterized protein n=1 Tax=Diabrotica virgifera virgifera TaxID=50390 RepID=A0ABM5IFL1_DIAVI|nr:uncharacterized protein LOC114327297 [Diabrotica virgifera virgifera]
MYVGSETLSSSERRQREMRRLILKIQKNKAASQTVTAKVYAPSDPEEEVTPEVEAKKPVTKEQVWEKKLKSVIELSLNTLVASLLNIPNKVEACHIAFCDDFKEGIVMVLERHRDRLQQSLEENNKESHILRKAVEDIFDYVDKMLEALDQDECRLMKDLNNTNTLLENAVRSDSRGLNNKNTADGD